MNGEKFCPECGEKIEAEERFCQNCGAEIPMEEAAGGANASDAPIIGAGARANVTGGIHQSSTSHTHVNTSNVDNSSTVNHNTTYVMNEKKKEFCEVCGNPLEEKHARCPKCGKEICSDCKVKGKSRCIECEKKAVNEYRVAFQQLLLTTNGNIGIAGRQMMDQKARELDVEDVKASIEKELLEVYKPINKPVQPDVTPMAATAAAASQVAGGSKGIGTLDGRTPIKPKTTGGGSKVGILVAVLLVVVVAVFFLLGGEKEKQQEAVAPTESVQQPEKVDAQVKPAVKQTTVTAQPVVVEENVSQPAAVEQTDTNYEAGMKAYEAKNGLEAISAFKKSGSAKSNYMLGVIYENGCGNVGKNAMMARKFFKAAAQMGSEEAKAKL